MFHTSRSTLLTLPLAGLCIFSPPVAAQFMPNLFPPDSVTEDSNKAKSEDESKAEAESRANVIAGPTPKVVEEVNSDLEALTKQVTALEKRVANKGQSDEALAKMRPAIANLESDLGKIAETLQPRLSDADNQLTKLGPAPAKDAPPEAEATADLRKQLNAKRASIEGAIKATGLLEVRTRQLRARIQNMRQALFADQILKQSPSPMLPSLWADVASEIPSASRRIATIFASAVERLQAQFPFVLAIAIATLLTYFCLRIALRRSTLRMLEARTHENVPNFFQRATLAGWVALSLALPAAVAALILFFGLDHLDVLYAEIKTVLQVALPAFLAYLGVAALARAILQPNRPQWRLFDLSGPTALRLERIFKGIAIVYALDLVFQEIIRAVYLPLSVRIAEAALANFAFAGLLLAIVLTPFAAAARPVVEETGPSLPAPVPGAFDPKILKLPLLALALLIAIGSAMGYVALGRFVASQVVVAGAIVVAALLCHLAIRALTAPTNQGRSAPLQTSLHKGLGMDAPYTGMIAKLTSFALHVGLLVAALPVLFLSWGYSIDDSLAWLKSLLFGFEVGQFRISLFQIFLAIGLFVLVLFLTRLVQRGINNRLMQPGGRIDQGVAHSVYTVVGYIGMAIATLIAVAYAGFDVTNLAIVAGALSVGIGFGLQSIVNNFVSGLIMLIERPIKVGDWIVVAGHEGYVRKISVRATELETFNRASVIVPNSDFMTSTVTNWTHRNAIGRVDLTVGVSYDSDPDEVMAILHTVTNDCAAVLRDPAPRVIFSDFGASSLDFTVQAFIADINQRMTTSSELRSRIFKAFGEAGIEIPFPQHDLHIRDLDPLRSALTRLAKERAGQAMDDVDETPDPVPKPAGMRRPSTPSSSLASSDGAGDGGGE